MLLIDIPQGLRPSSAAANPRTQIGGIRKDLVELNQSMSLPRE
eukprot:SAG11_NODE_1372_length_5095_cov_15.640312_2_plen_43_part_00